MTDLKDPSPPPPSKRSQQQNVQESLATPLQRRDHSSSHPHFLPPSHTISTQRSLFRWEHILHILRLPIEHQIPRRLIQTRHLRLPRAPTRRAESAAQRRGCVPDHLREVARIGTPRGRGVGGVVVGFGGVGGDFVVPGCEGGGAVGGGARGAVPVRSRPVGVIKLAGRLVVGSTERG